MCIRDRVRRQIPPVPKRCQSTRRSHGAIPRYPPHAALRTVASWVRVEPARSEPLPAVCRKRRPRIEGVKRKSTGRSARVPRRQSGTSGTSWKGRLPAPRIPLALAAAGKPCEQPDPPASKSRSRRNASVPSATAWRLQATGRPGNWLQSRAEKRELTNDGRLG